VGDENYKAGSSTLRPLAPLICGDGEAYKKDVLHAVAIDFWFLATCPSPSSSLISSSLISYLLDPASFQIMFLTASTCELELPVR